MEPRSYVVTYKKWCDVGISGTMRYTDTRHVLSTFTRVIHHSKSHPAHIANMLDGDFHKRDWYPAGWTPTKIGWLEDGEWKEMKVLDDPVDNLR